MLFHCPCWNDNVNKSDLRRTFRGSRTHADIVTISLEGHTSVPCSIQNYKSPLEFLGLIIILYNTRGRHNGAGDPGNYPRDGCYWSINQWQNDWSTLDTVTMSPLLPGAPSGSRNTPVQGAVQPAIVPIGFLIGHNEKINLVKINFKKIIVGGFNPWSGGKKWYR